MGRVKLQIKKIENTTNRQVTFSKRRNGLIKKAYELSVLCDVDVAVIMFSPSGRLGLFSGNKSIEEILTRYVNLPEHERGRLHNQEFLKRALGKLKAGYQEAGSSATTDSRLEEFQQEIDRFKAKVEDMEKQLRIFEGKLSHITTVCEAEYQEQILEEALQRLEMHKSDRVHLPSKSTAYLNGYATNENSNNFLDWLRERDQQVQNLNFLNSNGLFPLRDEEQRAAEILPSPSTLVHGQNNMNVDDHISPRNGFEDDNNNVEPPEFGQAIDVNMSPWTEFYPTGNSTIPVSQPREGAPFELYLSQITPSTN